MAYILGLLIFEYNIEAYKTPGRPINTSYFPLNKESSLEKSIYRSILHTAVNRGD
jgi:hypothetical protein